MCTEELLAVADVLEPRGDGWCLLELKASTTLKPIFDRGLAFQVEVARRLGVRVDGARVLRLTDNTSVIRPSTRRDAWCARTEAVRPHGSEGEVLAAHLERWETLRRSEVPDAIHGRHGTDQTKGAEVQRPSDCGHLGARGYCGVRLPEHWVGRLPRLSERKADALERMPRSAIGDLDPDEPAVPSGRAINAE